MPLNDLFELFLPPVSRWFRAALGEPTPAQRLGWPAIADAKHTLILAPTGSGKTLAAFLACLDALWRQPHLEPGVQVLYVSPLKALNNDIHRNLQVPLEGVAATARQMDFPLPDITAALRTGDTTSKERQQILRKPPHVLITTPESLHLMLTSQARSILGGVRWLIVDEIHAVCPNKRGVFLALLLERLEALNPQSFVRIGLSATQRPLDEVARFLGGRERVASDTAKWQPRDVHIVDAGLRRDLDLQVVSPVERFGPLPEKTIWPSIYRRLTDEIHAHRSTIIFANNRRTAERITTQLNELAEGAENNGTFTQAELAELPKRASPRELQNRVTNTQLARSHHGSISLEVRQQTEQALKEGRLPAVVATASLELGIDMGAVDLVCQVESPGSIARGLQRVGRSGHLVGQKSKGRLIAKTLPDLLEQAVLAREMLAGRVEAIRVPQNCLDILAQQIVAMVAVESWAVVDLFALIRRAYPYRDLTPEAFESVLEMISGRYPSDGFRDLRPRISWDRVHNQLHALPGSKQLALVNGGTIPDTGQYAAYIDGKDVRIGELDEEFIYERRIGDTFVLGTSAWRIEEIGDDRVLVSRAEGVPAIMPFWRGENVGRSRDLGLALCRFLRELADHLPNADCVEWLQRECHLESHAAANLRDYVKRQIEIAGCLPTDRTLLLEAFRDQVGDWHIAILSPFGARFNLALRLAVEATLRARYGYQPQCLHHDDGLLIRLSDIDDPPLDLLDELKPEAIEDLVRKELGDSALFAIRFRHNAARALLMPRAAPGKRAPLWLQRLKARGLLQIARQHPSFPVVVETYRECLQDHLDVPKLREWLQELRAGQVELVKRRAETPSPFASGLLFNFTAAFMYEQDSVARQGNVGTGLDRTLLDQILAPEDHGHLLDPRAIYQVERRLRGFGHPPRTMEEMADWLRRLGDLRPSELEGPMPQFLTELDTAGRASHFTINGTNEPERWILTEDQPTYAAAFSRPSTATAAETILKRFLHTHALVSLEEVLERYPFEYHWARQKLEEWARTGQLVPLRPVGTDAPEQWAAPQNFEQVQRGTVALLRREVLSVPPHQFAEFLLRWQHRHPDTQLKGPEGLRTVLHRLEGFRLPGELWEETVLPGRVGDYQTRWLDDLFLTGEWLWAAQQVEETGPDLVGFHRREIVLESPNPASTTDDTDTAADRVYEHLRQRGASFVVDIAQATELPPSRLRQALWRLLRRGLVTNDRFDVIRRGEEQDVGPELIRNGRSSLRSLRRRASQRPEGRWALIPWGASDAETRVIHQAYLLLERYGVVARELAMLDATLFPWRVLYEVFSRLELAGEVRRGYLVEGLSGAQFALPEAVEQLANLTAVKSNAVVLLHSLDPANLYGSGAPLAMPLLADDARPFQRRPGNWLVLRGGSPLLLIEAHGKRLRSAPNARREELADAITLLPNLLRTGQGTNPRGKVSVEDWNGQPATTAEHRDLLEATGFLNDYPALTLYAAWR